MKGLAGPGAPFLYMLTNAKPLGLRHTGKALCEEISQLSKV